MRVDVLHFYGCPNHQPAVDLVRQAAENVGVEIEVREIEVRDQIEAQRYRFLGSPTIQVDGVDIEPAARIRTDYAFSCRTYQGEGLPSADLIRAALGGSTEPQERGVSRAGTVVISGSVTAALAASACCWIPLMLIAFGISAGGVSAWFEQYRWLFLVLTAVLLGAGFYFVYFREPRCAPGAACATPNRRLQRFNRVMLWTATIVVIATAAFPKYVGYLIPQEAAAQTVVPANHVATASLGIDGMTCEGCAILVKNALVKVPGVLDVSVSYADSSATISFEDSTPPSSASLASAVEGAGYQADTSAMSR